MDVVFDTYMVSFCGTDSERNMVIKPMQIRTHDSVYIINIAEINNNDRRFKILFLLPHIIINVECGKVFPNAMQLTHHYRMDHPEGL